MKFEIKPILLLLAIISASLFMVVESGEYYSTFYKNSFQGYWAAFLVETFLAVSAMLYVAEKRYLNICIKLVMIPLFVVVVLGASLKVVSPMISQLAQVKSQQKLVEQLQKINQQSQVHLALLQGQKTNTALAIKHQQQISNQLVDELKDSPSTYPWMIWVAIGFSTFLRLSVQLANLVFAHTFGELRKCRNRSSHSEDNNKKETNTRKSNLQFKLQKIYRYLVKNGGEATRGQILASRVLKGGVKEYDSVLGKLEKVKKIKVDRENVSKVEWMYSVI